MGILNIIHNKTLLVNNFERKKDEYFLVQVTIMPSGIRKEMAPVEATFLLGLMWHLVIGLCVRSLRMYTAFGVQECKNEVNRLVRRVSIAL